MWLAVLCHTLMSVNIVLVFKYSTIQVQSVTYR